MGKYFFGEGGAEGDFKKKNITCKLSKCEFFRTIKGWGSYMHKNEIRRNNGAFFTCMSDTSIRTQML